MTLQPGVRRGETGSGSESFDSQKTVRLEVPAVACGSPPVRRSTPGPENRQRLPRPWPRKTSGQPRLPGRHPHPPERALPLRGIQTRPKITSRKTTSAAGAATSRTTDDKMRSRERFMVFSGAAIVGRLGGASSPANCTRRATRRPHAPRGLPLWPVAPDARPTSAIVARAVTTTSETETRHPRGSVRVGHSLPHALINLVAYRAPGRARGRGPTAAALRTLHSGAAVS
jgi:hypothetical protein